MAVDYATTICVSKAAVPKLCPTTVCSVHPASLRSLQYVTQHCDDAEWKVLESALRTMAPAAVWHLAERAAFQYGLFISGLILHSNVTTTMPLTWQHICLSAALRGKELAIITTSNVAFRKIQTLCSSAFASQIIIITVLLGSKEINENLGFPHRCNSVLSTLTHDVLKISCKRRLMLSVCELLQPHMIASGDWWIEQNCGHKENIKSVYLTCRLTPTHICNQWPAIHKKPKSPWCLISS